MIVLVASTSANNMRCDIQGWTYEDASLFVPGKEIGYTPSPSPRVPHNTILEALADGYRLLSPPAYLGGEWEWWLTKG